MGYPPDLEQQVKRIEMFEARNPSPEVPQCYGLGKWLRRDLGLPEAVPLHIHMDHGVRVSEAMTNCDLLSDRPIFFTSAAQRDEYFKQTGKRAYVSGSPFVACRRLNQIELDPEASGTVAFPVHSTHLIDVAIDWDKYADDLLNLPAEFQPVTMCLYWKDLLAGHHKPFLDRGISVVTTGHMADPDFATNFYAILRRHRYCTSNLVGSYTFYAVEMGIPFFIYGVPPVFNNHGHDHNRPAGTYTIENLDDDRERRDWIEFQRLFELDVTQGVEICDRTRDRCLAKLGIDQADSPATLRRVIYQAWMSHLARWPLNKARGAAKKLRRLAQPTKSRLTQALTGNIRHLEGVAIPASEMISPIIRQTINSGVYEFGEITLLKKYLEKHDIVMEIGGGLGFLSGYCAKKIGDDRVFTYEANPVLKDAIHTLHAKNGVSPSVAIAMVANTEDTSKTEKFYVTQDFWSSSPVQPTAEVMDRVIEVPVKSFKQELEKNQPTLLVVDIEGGEYDLFAQATLDTVRKLIIEVHAVLGPDQLAALKTNLTGLGFRLVEVIPNCDDAVWYLQRSSL
ncbi:FkbM family methyltransferase [Nodosilinea sp. LEGE 07088]|uniref:FkbM family methyltransferase n=1 Tax=Nodosilinea sp. LEGE 07088 TaxID=2777968 RepID=UPI00187EB644|nr:FkbM family methyltransferase [Nodosilinea sp. LEGE 07088]MBE9138806.1 FkbM family methyltransferase [Nodosilinea sp. LEGE 07088]